MHLNLYGQQVTELTGPQENQVQEQKPSDKELNFQNSACFEEEDAGITQSGVSLYE